MATSTPPPRAAAADENESFTSMSDVEAIGAHCQYSYCNQLDFLPFRCSSCKGKYCLDHRTETAHACPKEGEWAAARRRANLKTTANTAPPPSTRTLSPAPPSSTCALPTCSTKIHTSLNLGVHCPTCQRDYCLPHRMSDSHLCSTLTPLGARPALPSQTDRARIAFAKLRAWGIRARQASTPAPAKPARQSPATASLAELKTTATGDAKVPTTSRVYVSVEAEAEAAGPAADHPLGAFFFAREARVGRVLDEAARGLKVRNVNNRGGGEESRLRVFHVEGGRVLGFGERLVEEAGVRNGHTLVLLRGLGAAEG
ncbi:MAG: hypothetical protein M1829_002087 [Trizodia sp. TS-e1964]|nr:MAG: hypothetical protein M1829_002087 [Trizodia sp. TS-e1964]